MNKVLFIDLLTTGPNAQRCGIYALGGILCEDTPSSIRELRRFEYRIRPFEECRISDKSLWIGGVSRSQLLYFKKEDEILDALTGMLSQHIQVSDPADKVFICGFNSAAFDMPFLKELFERNESNRFRDFFHMQSIDMMTISAYSLMDERSQMKEFNLDTVAKKLGVIAGRSPEYSCLDNAETILTLYRKLKERLGKGEYGEHSKTDSVEII